MDELQDLWGFNAASAYSKYPHKQILPIIQYWFQLMGKLKLLTEQTKQLLAFHAIQHL